MTTKTVHLVLDAETRLREWGELSTEVPNFYGSENTIHRMMVGSTGSGGSPGNGPTPGMVEAHKEALERYGRVLEVQRIVETMPEDYRQVIRIEFAENGGWRKAVRELEWTQRMWYGNRHRMIGFLEARLTSAHQ